MNFEQIPIEQLIPQRPPFVLVDRLIHYEALAATTEFFVGPNCILLNGTRLSEAGLVENIAQTCACYIGYRNRTQPVKIGVIGAIKNFEIQATVPVESHISTDIQVEADIFDMLLVKGQIRLKDSIVVTCEMKISLID